ncbi:MAG: substrate-binding domain-containing protein [Chloroherpetonaceae bacterium]|nr:substrate-binding domain-containing protein [Chloroherpetonaceae bacterium]
MQRLLHILLVGLLAWLFVQGCSGSSEDRNETTTEGTLRYAIDESLAPAMEPQRQEFTRIWQSATLIAETLQTRAAVQRLLDRKVRLIVINRDLKPDEVEAFKKLNIQLEKRPVGVDGVCFLVHPENPVRQLKLSQLRDILSGAVTNWSQVGGANAPIQLLITSPNDGMRDLLQDSLLKSLEFSKLAYPCTSFAQMKTYMQRTKHFLAYTGTAHARPALNVKQMDTTAFKVLALAADSANAEAVMPFQANVYEGKYPFAHFVYVAHLRGEKLPIGFTSFLLREGQQIFVRHGYAPYKVPIRIVNFKED